MSAPPCPCVPTYVVGNRYKLPLGRNVVDKATMKKHGGLMKGTDVDFGSHGFSIQDLVDTPIHVLSSIIPDKEFKPFQWYAISPGMVFPVEMKIHVRSNRCIYTDPADEASVAFLQNAVAQPRL